MRVAIIDMGTNIFNMLVADINTNKTFNIVNSLKYPVKLGEGGFMAHKIMPDAWERALNAINMQMDFAKQLNVEKIFAFATSATRDASNGHDFAQTIMQRFNLKVEIIDGEREANLIYNGVKQAFDLGNVNNLIVDIGGGSNEIIIANAHNIKWLHSFNLGVLRLHQMFNTSDPITTNEVNTIENYIKQQLKPLFEAIKELKPSRLVGSSGLFDSFRDMMICNGTINASPSSTWVQIPTEHYLQLHQKLLRTSVAERLTIAGLNPIRADYIVLASIFVEIVLREGCIPDVFQSEYALKEGFLGELAAGC